LSDGNIDNTKNDKDINHNPKWDPESSISNNDDANIKGYTFNGKVVIGIAIIIAIATGSTVYAMILSESSRIHLSTTSLMSKNNAKLLSSSLSSSSLSSSTSDSLSSHTVKAQPFNQQQQQQLVNKKFVLVQHDFGWNGTNGGPTMRVNKGDVVQITIINAGQMAHNFGIAKLSAQTTNIMNNVMLIPVSERVQKIPYNVMAAMPCPGCQPKFEEGHITKFMNPDTQMVTTFRANEAGNYKYFCMVRGHIWLGMIGELDVINAGSPPSIPTATTSPLAQQQRAGAT
jgi:FtsP/CotA-like multicopper oxidase with cupredoxin domain